MIGNVNRIKHVFQGYFSLFWFHKAENKFSMSVPKAQKT